MDIRLNRRSATPMHLQIARQLREQILRGAIAPHRRLPSTRSLAGKLGVNRGTVTQAYQQLWSEGLVDGHVGRGTIVRLPTGARERAVLSPPWNLLLDSRAQGVRDEVRELSRLIAREDLVSLAAGLPPSELYPLDALRDITAEVLTDQGRSLLSWCPIEGYLPLRQLVAESLGGNDASEVLVLSGSTQGLALIAHAMIAPGDVVLVESPTYLGALQVFRTVGARLLGIPMSEAGMDLEMLEEALARTQPKLIYTVPTFQNPMGATLDLPRRRALLELAYRYRVPLVEDDAYRWLYYDVEPPPTLRQLDSHDYVIHLGTFTKTLVPGLRLGYVAAPQAVVEHLVASKYLQDLFTNSLAQVVVERFWRRGLFERHVQAMRQAYRQRRDAMVAALRRHCPHLGFATPPGGFFIWGELPLGVGATQLLRTALDEGVSFMAGPAFHVDGQGHDRIRLTFPSASPTTIRKGIKRLGAALGKFDRRLPESPAQAASLTRPIL